MKKILLSLTLIAALTIGTGVMAFATENNVANVDGGTVTEANTGDTVITSEELAPIEEAVNPNCPCGREDGKERENCDGTGNRKYDGTGMGNGNCDGTGIGNENCDGTGKEGNGGQGKLQGQGMKRGQGNCNR